MDAFLKTGKDLRGSIVQQPELICAGKRLGFGKWLCELLGVSLAT